MNTNIIENMNNSDIDAFFDRAQPFFGLMTYYGCALREVETKFQVLNDEFKLSHDRNPIESIKSRIKSVKSIALKLERKGISLDSEDMEENIARIENSIFDIAGIRVICAFPEDIYRLAGQLTGQDDITLVREKDYIRNPKPNGYRSLHLIVEIPVFFSTGKRQMKVEVQLRTIAMDFWASLEHKMKYKKNVRNRDYISEELLKCSRIISETDYRMQEIRWLIESAEEAEG
ncbi:MAG: GTP pyrophosphokinase family protein [Ruminococcus sp.]|nr:GTP pyrophosphokinase family protein [Ruminococcus sp.]